DTAVCELFERTDMSEDERSPRSDKRSPRGVFERPKGSGVWWVCYFDENGPERIRRRDVLLADFFKDYLGRVKGRLRSYREYDRYAKRLTAAFPGRTLRQLLPADIERYVAKRVQDVSPATVNRDLQFLKHVFYVAMKDGLCERNPVREVRLFKENNQRVRFLTEADAAR